MKRKEFVSEMITKVFGIKNFELCSDGSGMYVRFGKKFRVIYVDENSKKEVILKFKWWEENAKEMKKFLKEKGIKGEVGLSNGNGYYRVDYLYVKFKKKPWSR